MKNPLWISDWNVALLFFAAALRGLKSWTRWFYGATNCKYEYIFSQIFHKGSMCMKCEIVCVNNHSIDALGILELLGTGKDWMEPILFTAKWNRQFESLSLFLFNLGIETLEQNKATLKEYSTQTVLHDRFLRSFPREIQHYWLSGSEEQRSISKQEIILLSICLNFTAHKMRRTWTTQIELSGKFKIAMFIRFIINVQSCFFSFLTLTNYVNDNVVECLTFFIGLVCWFWIGFRMSPIEINLWIFFFFSKIYKTTNETQNSRGILIRFAKRLLLTEMLFRNKSKYAIILVWMRTMVIIDQ